MKLRITCAALACTLLLAGCAAGEGTAVSSSAEPSVSTAAEPAITPEPTAEPTPEPTPAPTPNPASLLEYTMLPLDSTKETPANFWWYSMSLRDDTAKENAHRLAMGLYNNDVEEVRAACSERVLTDTFPLDDLDGLSVTEAALYGGEYDSPFLSLTVTDPGNTPFLCGRHEYYLSFDADGKVDWLGRSPFYEDTQSVTLASYYESPSEDVSFWGITSAELTNPLGLTWGPASLQCYDAYWVLNEDDDGHHYENRSVQDLGSVEAPPYGITSYAVPPNGNVLTDTKLEVVCEALNQFFYRAGRRQLYRRILHNALQRRPDFCLGCRCAAARRGHAGGPAQLRLSGQLGYAVRRDLGAAAAKLLGGHQDKRPLHRQRGYHR